jgi:hypothetical protein
MRKVGHTTASTIRILGPTLCDYRHQTSCAWRRRRRVVSILEHSEAFSGRGTQPVLSNRRPQRSMIQNAMAVEKVVIQTLLLFFRTARSIIDIASPPCVEPSMYNSSLVFSAHGVALNSSNRNVSAFQPTVESNEFCQSTLNGEYLGHPKERDSGKC